MRLKFNCDFNIYYLVILCNVDKIIYVMAPDKNIKHR